MGKIDRYATLKFYAGKRVFVTGHTGFKGTWLVALLHQLGADVRGYALAPVSNPNHFNLLKIDAKIDSVINDIRDPDALKASVAEFQPDVVFHLAAQALVGQSYDDPAATFDTNVMGSTNLLEAVRHCPSVKSLVYITSDKCYENVEWEWGYRENDRLGGRDPYSASKAAAELIFSAYDRSFFADRADFAAATARAGNVIGGGDWADKRIVPDCVRAIAAREPVRLRSPHSTRPWQHVLEPLSGYLQLGAGLVLDPARHKGAWNFGPSTHEVRTVEDVANAIVEQLGHGSVENIGDASQPYEARLLQLNCDKAHQILGWAPRWDVDKTLAMTAKWYVDFLNGKDVAETTRLQLLDYFEELT